VKDRLVSPVFVGRTAELATLAAAYEQAVTDWPAMAIVAGEAGIGKSRLVAEFAGRLTGKPLVLHGSCLELGVDGLPFAPFVAVFRRLIREVGVERVTGLLPGTARRLASWLPELGPGPAERDEEYGKALLFEEILTLLEKVAADRPIAMVLEDLHWADASSRDLLMFLSRNLTQRGILIVGTCRTNELDGAHPLRLLAWALVAAWQAAGSAGRAYAYEDQLRMLERVLALWDLVADPTQRLGVDHAEVLERATESCFASDDAERGVVLATAALAEVDQNAQPDRAARILLLRGALKNRLDADGLADLEAGLRLLPAHVPSITRGQILATLAISLGTVDYAAARPPAQEALNIGRHTGDLATQARALTALSGSTALGGDLDAALEQIAEAKQKSREASDNYATLTAFNYETTVLAYFGEYERAVAVGREGMVLARRLGLERSRGSVMASYLGWCLFALGRWQEAQEVLDDALALDPAPVYQAVLQFPNGLLALARGDVAAAARAATVVASFAENSRQEALMPWRYHLECPAAAAQGDLDKASRLLDRALANSLLADRPDDVWLVVIAGARLQRAMRGRQRAVLRALCQSTRVIGRRELALCATANAELTVDDPALWEVAITAWRDLGVPHELACCLLRAAEVALASGDRPGAPDRLREAAAIAADLGAAPLIAEIDHLAARGRLELSAARPTPRPFGLTPREIEVLRLVATGMSNRRIADALFISPSTAGVHVSNILAKLALTSRTEAAALAHRLGLLSVGTRTSEFEQATGGLEVGEPPC